MANISYGVNIIPKTNNAYTLGNSDYKWANIFTNKINGTDVASIIAGEGSGGEGSSIDVSDKVDKAALLDAGITDSTYTVAFSGSFTVTTATDNDHTIPYAKATPTGTIDKYKRFRVTINDTEYVMESGIWFINNKYYNYLGNLTKIYDHAAWIPGGIIDVPFLITFDRDNNSSIEVWTTTAGTYTIKIETITDTFKKLPSELIYGSAYPPILQCKNEGSTFSGYSLGVNILRDRRGTMAFGYGNELVADFALAIGTAHSISGEDATAIGFNNSIHSNLDTSLGAQNIMYGSSPYSTTVGMGNTIYSNSSYSGTFGYRNAIEPYSQYAHALGYWNICDGKNAYALGYSNCAFSDQTMAIGNGTTASAKDQIVLGTLNVSETADTWVASTSYAVGDIVYKNNRLYKCITANSDSSFTSSKWERCRGQFLEILGNGDLGTLNRSNARATDWDGNTYIKGDVYVGCDADSSGGTKLISATAYATTSNCGVIKVGSGLDVDASGTLTVKIAGDPHVKQGTSGVYVVPCYRQHAATFYGLAKAAGDSTQSSSSNAIGTYTDDAKSAIQSMLGISTMTGATSSAAGSGGLVPAPATTDVDKFLAGDGTYKSGGLPMVILSYGSSTWAQFEAAYNNNVIVYCRASSNSNPASGSQTRMAFMAYVNNATTPTEVEFQYYRSMSSHSATAMGDQVFVYKLTKTGGWSVTTRDASIKEINVASGSKLGVSWSSNKVTLSNTMTANDMPMSSSDATTVKSSIDTLNSNIATKSTRKKITGTSSFSALNIGYAGAALDELHAVIASTSSGIHPLSSNGGPMYYAFLGKYSESYYCGYLVTYSDVSDWISLRFAYENGTFKVWIAE